MTNAEERHFVSHDGRELFYRHWPASSGKSRGAVVLFHRGHEHSGRMAHLVDELALPDFDFFAWDARGHGRSGREGVEADTAHALTRDVDAFIAHIGATHGIAAEDIVVVGQSVGAVLLAAWAHDYAPRIRAMVLAAPAFSIKLYVPFARAGLRLLQAIRGNFFVTSYVKGRFLTHDAERAASYETDPLIVRPISVRLLLGLDALAKRVVADANAIVVPTQLLVSGADWVVHAEPQHDFYERLGAVVKERIVLDGFYHDTLGEAERTRAAAHVREFVLTRFNEPSRRPSLLDADERGSTRQEADRLARPLRRFSVRGLYWLFVKLGLRIGGWLSKGIRLGHETGFDSGSTLDYVYRNEPDGFLPLGKGIDRLYLDAIGWRGIRCRKTHVEEFLGQAVARLRARDVPVRVTDIAAGHGRYVLDALEGLPEQPDSVMLRDYSELNVSAGTKLIEARGRTAIASFQKGDAFDRDALAAIAPRPTIAIVSGLYELFASNALVRRSLDGLAAAVDEGGYLIYTGQPWHPQLEFIARALTSHRQGQSWVMRRRTQAEMDDLVAAAGFTKLDQRIDEWGIFTVSLARRDKAAASGVAVANSSGPRTAVARAELAREHGAQRQAVAS